MRETVDIELLSSVGARMAAMLGRQEPSQEQVRVVAGKDAVLNAVEALEQGIVTSDEVVTLVLWHLHHDLFDFAPPPGLGGDEPGLDALLEPLRPDVLRALLG